MTTDYIGNLGKIAKMQNKIGMLRMHNYGKATPLSITSEELAEIEQTIGDFEYVLRNMNMYENQLKADQYGALVTIIAEMKEKDYA